jgi:hypothetical protein
VVVTAYNSSPTRSAYVAQDLASGDFFVTRGDVAAGTGFSPALDLSPYLSPNFDLLGLTTFAYDPSADRAYFLAEDQTIPCEQQSPQLVTIDFTAGTVTKRDLGIGAGDTNGFYQLALDPETHAAAIATSCQAQQIGRNRNELTMVNLATGATTRAFQHLVGVENYYHGGDMLGGDSAIVGIDTVNHLILQRSIFCPAVLANFDINARVCLNEYDESGRLAKTVPGLFSAPVPPVGGYVQGWVSYANAANTSLNVCTFNLRVSRPGTSSFKAHFWVGETPTDCSVPADVTNTDGQFTSTVYVLTWQT